MLTNIFTNIRSPYVQSITEIPDVLHDIKTGRYQHQITEARSYGKGHKEFEKIKSIVPTFSPNGCFYEKRSTSNLVSLSGFIYIDIDNYSDKESLYHLPFVYSVWRSFSGTGLGVLVSISGLTEKTFQQSWTYLNDQFSKLNIEIDPQAKDIARQCIISFDPEIYINPDSVPLNIPAPILKSDTSICSTNTYSNEYYSTSTVDEEIRYVTALDDYHGMDYIVIEEGKEYRIAYLPKTISEGHRHKWMSSFILTLIFNNPTISFERLIAEVQSANSNHCDPKLPVEEIVSMTKWCYNKHVDRKLNIRTRMKKIWFNPESVLSGKEKQVLAGKETGKIKRQKTIEHLVTVYLALQQTEKKVTQQKLTDHSDRSIRTIKKYWKEIRERCTMV
jgi:hypothetical protein